jgi:hypothetical protein
MSYYGAALAYIHDEGFREYSLAAAPGLLAILWQHGIARGLVVDHSSTNDFRSSIAVLAFQGIGFLRLPASRTLENCQ